LTAYLIIAAALIGTALMLMAFIYPELLVRGGKGLVKLLIAGGRFVSKLGLAVGKRIAKGVRGAERHLFPRPAHPKKV